jgi:hypothetical protein
MPYKNLTQKIIENLTKFIFYLNHFLTEDNYLNSIKSCLILIEKFQKLKGYEDFLESIKYLINVIKTKSEETIFINSLTNLININNNNDDNSLTSNEFLEIIFDYILLFISSSKKYFADKPKIFELFYKMINLLKNLSSEENSSILKFKILDCFENIFNENIDEFMNVYRDCLSYNDKNFLNYFLEKHKI